MNDNDDILAAEFALGLLDDAEAATVIERARADAVLSLRIAWWRDQFAPLARETETLPPERLWARIAQQLPDNDNVTDDRVGNRIQRWRAAAIVATSVAAGLLGYIVLQPAPTPTLVEARSRPQQPLIATLAGIEGTTVAVRYDERHGTLAISPTALEAGRGDAELWLIPEGLLPISLGIINTKNAQDYPVPDHLRKLVLPGTILAVTQEVRGGSPTGRAQGPVVAGGKIIRG